MAAPNSDVKNFIIKGGAAEAYLKVGKTRKRKQSGGFDVPSVGEIVPTPVNLSRVRNMVSQMKGGASTAAAGAGAATGIPAPPTLPAPTPPSAADQQKGQEAILGQKPMQTGGAKKKLILEPKKKSMKKLHLAPSSVSGSKIKSKTRKIRVNLTGMKKRLTRAKSIHADSRNKDIAEIKKTLHEAKLLKPKTSDKPDSPEYDLLLRKTYENYMLIRNRAL